MNSIDFGLVLNLHQPGNLDDLLDLCARSPERRGAAPGRRFGARARGPVDQSARHGRRRDRRWAQSWSPEQISNRLCLDFPDDESMRVSHEAIYQALYVQGRGALRRELTACGPGGRCAFRELGHGAGRTS